MKFKLNDVTAEFTLRACFSLFTLRVGIPSMFSRLGMELDRYVPIAKRTPVLCIVSNFPKMFLSKRPYMCAPKSNLDSR